LTWILLMMMMMMVVMMVMMMIIIIIISGYSVRRRCVRLTTLPPSCAVVNESGNLKFLEPFGPPQACNGTAFTYCLDSTVFWAVNCASVLMFWANEARNLLLAGSFISSTLEASVLTDVSAYYTGSVRRLMKGRCVLLANRL
jgi:hypothetical protein